MINLTTLTFNTCVYLKNPFKKSKDKSHPERKNLHHKLLSNDLCPKNMFKKHLSKSMIKRQITQWKMGKGPGKQ